MASCDILLITEQDVKELTGVSNNVPSSKFCYHIEPAQNIHIKPLIGEACFDELLDQVENSTLTVANNLLLNGNGN